MALLVVLGLMSVGWMVVIAAVVLAHKLMAPKAAIDVPVALAIVGLGILIMLAPSSVPGLMPRCDRVSAGQRRTVVTNEKEMKR